MLEHDKTNMLKNEMIRGRKKNMSVKRLIPEIGEGKKKSTAKC